MTEEEIEAVINKHFFAYNGKCECGEYRGVTPDYIAKHLARKIYEAMLDAA